MLSRERGALSAAARRRHYRRLREAFAAAPVVATLDYRIVRLDEGFARIGIRNRPELRQERGRLHGALLGLLADAAGAYAVLTLVPGGEVLTIEFKINFLTGAVGKRVFADARVVRLGKTVAVTEMDVWCGPGEKVAVGLGTYRVFSPDGQEGSAAPERAGSAGARTKKEK